MKLELGYGQGVQTVEVPDQNLLGVLEPNPVPAGLTGTFFLRVLPVSRRRDAGEHVRQGRRRKLPLKRLLRAPKLGVECLVDGAPNGTCRVGVLVKAEEGPLRPLFYGAINVEQGDLVGRARKGDAPRPSSHLYDVRRLETLQEPAYDHRVGADAAGDEVAGHPMVRKNLHAGQQVNGHGEL